MSPLVAAAIGVVCTRIYDDIKIRRRKRSAARRLAELIARDARQGGPVSIALRRSLNGG